MSLNTTYRRVVIRKQKRKSNRRPRPQRQRVHLAVTACCVVREVRGRAGLSPPPRPFPCRVRDNAVTAVTPVPGHVDRSQHALVVAAACRTRERAPHLRLVRREGCDGGADGGGGKGGGVEGGGGDGGGDGGGEAAVRVAEATVAVRVEAAKVKVAMAAVSRAGLGRAHRHRRGRAFDLLLRLIVGYFARQAQSPEGGRRRRLRLRLGEPPGGL